MRYFDLVNEDEDPIPFLIQVSVFPNRRAYLRYLRTKRSPVGVRLAAKGTAAMCLSYFPDQVPINHPQCELVFYPKEFDVDSITHEVFHALLSIYQNANLPLAENEESFACTIGRLSQEVFDWRTTLLKDPKYAFA